MHVSVVNRLLAYANFEDIAVKCAASPSVGTTLAFECTADESIPSDAFRHSRYVCRKSGGSWKCDEDVDPRIGEPVQVIDTGNDGYVTGYDEKSELYSIVSNRGTIQRPLELLRRPNHSPFATIRNRYIDIPLLALLPSALILRRGEKLHLCCHGCLDPAIQPAVRSAGGLVALFAGSMYLYEQTSGTYVTDMHNANCSARDYSLHCLKWGDMTVDAQKRIQTPGRPLLSFDELTVCADALGLDNDYAVISGHQDLVNIGGVGPLGNSPPPFVDALNLPSTHPYYEQMHVFDGNDGAFAVPYRFVCTSSAVYSKKSDTFGDASDTTLTKNCWLCLDDQGLMAHLTPSKAALPPDFRIETTVIDALKFWDIVEYISEKVNYPIYEPNGLRPRRSQVAQTRLFSITMVNAVLGAATQMFAKHAKANSVYYQLLQTTERARVCILGDLHSCIDSLAKMLTWCRKNAFFHEDDSIRLRDDHYIVFLGDLVDRGPFGIDILVIVMMLKVANEGQVIVIDGNHETHPIYNKDGLSDEVRNEYGDDL